MIIFGAVKCKWKQKEPSVNQTLYLEYLIISYITEYILSEVVTEVCCLKKFAHVENIYLYLFLTYHSWNVSHHMFLIEYNCKNESQKRVNIITYMQ